MRIVFLGTPRAAVPSLLALIREGHDLPLVVTQPDRPVGRSRTPVASPVKEAALEHGCAVFQPTKVRNEAFRRRLAECEPDLLVVVAYGRILTAGVLGIGRFPAVNVHFSLLPKYRGAAPVQWTLARGETVSGVTTMRMNERMDEGDLLLQLELPIEPGEHAPQLERRLARSGSELLLRTLAGLERGTLEPRPQDPSRATYAPILTRADGEIDLGLTAREIEGRVRGFDPWPGVWARRSGKRLRIVEARALEGAACDEPPGRVIELTPDGLVMACAGGGRLLLVTVQAEGRRRLSSREAVNGRQLLPGDRLEGTEAEI